MAETERAETEGGSGGGSRWGRHWAKPKRQAFLDHLAATCNVRAAAEAGGINPVNLYQIRRTDPAFRAEWREALEAGYEMLETLLVGHAIAGGGREIIVGIGDPIDRDLALRLLSFHRNGLNGRSPRGGPPLKQVSSEETDKAILKKLAAIERRRAAKA